MRVVRAVVYDVLAHDLQAFAVLFALTLFSTTGLALLRNAPMALVVKRVLLRCAKRSQFLRVAMLAQQVLASTGLVEFSAVGFVQLQAALFEARALAEAIFVHFPALRAFLSSTQFAMVLVPVSMSTAV